MTPLFQPTTEMPELFPYQRDVIERLRARVRMGQKRLIMQGSTGAGKGHALAYLARLAWDKGQNVLILNDRRKIVNQLSERLDLFGVPHGVLMSQVRPSDANVQLASRDTLASRVLRNEWIDLPPASLVIVDEAHKSGELYQTLLGRYPNAVVIGATATPANGDGTGLSTSYWQGIECMIPTSELIKQGRLTPVKCFAPERLVKGKAVGKGLRGHPVSHWKRLAAGRPTVAFTSKVEQSRALVDAFNDADIPAEHIDGNTSDEQREAVLTRLRAGMTMVVSNCSVISEGADIPELSCCIILRMAGSKVLYLQMVGRIMRSHPSKNGANILIDHAGACVRHGLPDEDVEWTLDENDTVDKRHAEARKDGRSKKPLICPRCAALFAPGSPLCPECHYKLRAKKTAAPVEDELLIEVPREQKILAEAERHRRLWRKYIGLAANTGRTCGAAAMMFRKAVGRGPEDCNLADLPQGADWKRPASQVFPHMTRGF